jgi:hypothetical protein
MKKRGQTTIFIILIIVILGIIFFLISFGSRITPSLEPEEFPDLELYVQGCLDDIVKIGESSPIVRANTPGTTFESRLQDYVESNLPLICDDFSRFNEYELSVEPLENVQATLNPNRNLFVEVEWPIKITRGDKVVIIKDFFTKDSLSVSCCFDVAVDSNCKSIESRQVNACGIYKNFNPGDDISFNYDGIGDVCVAC